MSKGAMEQMPMFNNSCGKIFQDRLIFAFSNSEKEVPIRDLSGINFRKDIKYSSLTWLLLPLAGFILLYIEKEKLGGFTFTLIALALIAFTAAMLKTAEWFYFITLHLKDNSKIRIRVSKDNRKDATKFISKAVKNIEKARRNNF